MIDPMTDSRAISLQHLIGAKRSIIEVCQRKINEESLKINQLYSEIVGHENELERILTKEFSR